MISIYQRALGDEFKRLHPQIRRKFEITSADGVMSFGRGVMESIWKGRFYTTPFLHLGAKRRVLFAETGSNIPFELENYSYVDGLGRETVTWNRTFGLATPRRFDETMIFSERRRCIVVYAGTHQHVAVELHLRASADGSLSMQTGAQRLFEWPIGIRFPLLLSGVARVHLRFDDDAQHLCVNVDIRNRIFGTIFGYRGWVTSEFRPCLANQIPADARPRREERRE